MPWALPETDEALCARSGANCGELTADDNCGMTRTIASCGPCDGAGESCTDNVCSCTGQTQTELCMEAGWECGAGAVTDQCGVSRNINCGGCPILYACTAQHTCKFL